MASYPSRPVASAGFEGNQTVKNRGYRLTLAQEFRAGKRNRSINFSIGSCVAQPPIV